MQIGQLEIYAKTRGRQVVTIVIMEYNNAPLFDHTNTFIIIDKQIREIK